nr:hypothetical protein [Tanacetum cinerariifolium]
MPKRQEVWSRRFDMASFTRVTTLGKRTIATGSCQLLCPNRDFMMPCSISAFLSTLTCRWDVLPSTNGRLWRKEAPKRQADGERDPRCQLMDQNIDFSGSDQIQTPQHPDIHPPSQEISEEVFHAKGDLMKSIQTFLEEFNYIPFAEKPKILLQAWDNFFAIQHAQPKDSNELFQKLLEDLQIINKELTKCNHPTFFDDNEDHFIQYKEYLDNSSKEIANSNLDQEKEKPPQDFGIHQLVREECCEEQKHNMENTMLELVEEKQEIKNVVEQPTEHGTHIAKSLQNFRVIHKKSSISLKNTSQISPVHEIAPILLTKDPEHSLSMGYKHLNTTPKMKSDEIIKSGIEELVPILNEYELTSEDKRECDVLVCEDSSTFDVCDDHSEIFFDSNNNDNISSNDDAFEDIEYVEASLLVSELFSLEEKNDVCQEDEEIFFDSNNNDNISSNDDAFEDIEYVEASLLVSELFSLEEKNDVCQEDEEVDLEDIFQIQDVVLREKLLSINRLIANIESLNDNPTPDCVFKSSSSFPMFEETDKFLSFSEKFSPEFETFSDHTEEMSSERLTSVVKNDISDDSSNDPLLEEVDLFFASDNSIPPGIENFSYDSEGDIHFLEELLINDSILFPNNESFDFEDDPLFPRPHPEPPNDEFKFEPNS